MRQPATSVGTWSTPAATGFLPSSFAPQQAVYKAFVRWVEVDAFEQMQDRLRQQW